MSTRRRPDFFGPAPTPALPRVGGVLPTYAYRTNSGKILDFSRPEDATIDAEDVAHNLARICRYSGAVDGFYSVASHCVYVSRQLEAHGASPYVQAAGLLHDAAEAYLGDVVSGLKRLLPEYRGWETQWEARIERHFDVYFSAGSGSRVYREVKDADLRARLAEARDLFVEYPYDRADLLGGEGNREPYEAKVVCETPDEAEWAWCARARELGLWREPARRGGYPS